MFFLSRLKGATTRRLKTRGLPTPALNHWDALYCIFEIEMLSKVIDTSSFNHSLLRECSKCYNLLHVCPENDFVYVFMCCVVISRFKNVMFDISPTEEVGDFEVKAKFLGVEMDKVQLHFQVSVSQVWQNSNSSQVDTKPS